MRGLLADLDYFWRNTAEYSFEFLARDLRVVFDCVVWILLLNFCSHLLVVILTRKQYKIMIKYKNYSSGFLRRPQIWQISVHFKLTIGGFFQNVRFVFQISQKNYSKKLSWAWNLNNLFTDMGENFNFQGKDSFLGIIFLGDWEIWKRNLTFWKKGTFN